MDTINRVPATTPSAVKEQKMGTADVAKQMTGRVRVQGDAFQSLDYFTIDCPNAPDHLRVLHLERWALRSAKPGDRVTLEYRKTGRGYEWVVTEVLA